MKNKFKIVSLLFLLITATICCSGPDDSADSKTFKAEYSIQQNADELLVGQTINFLNTSTVNNSSAINYLWEFGDGQTSTVQNPTHAYSLFGIYIVKLTITSGNKTNSVSKEFIISLSSIIPGRDTLLQKLNTSNSKILICAHRGSREDAPENSLAAVAEAISNNISMVELDVRQTKDGVLVLMHDTTINRTTNGTGTISSMTYQELLQFNLKKSNGTLTTDRIPTLSQVLQLARGNIYIDLDIDDKAPALKVYKLAKQFGMINQVLFWSTSYADINSLLQQNTAAIAMPSIYSQNDFTSYSNPNLIVKVVHYNSATFNTSFVNQANVKGWFIFSNAYVNTSAGPTSDSYAQINYIISLDGDIIQTDYPTLVKNYLISQNLY